LLFDSTNYESFEHVNDWLQEAKRQIEPNNAIFMLVGTKVDKDNLREVPQEQAQQFADYHNLLYCETSSKTGHNVEKTFADMGLKIYEMIQDGKFKMQDGWEGIRPGYQNKSLDISASRQPAFNLIESNDNNESYGEKKSCC
jgi:GTPase SAR1 family protein